MNLTDYYWAKSISGGGGSSGGGVMKVTPSADAIIDGGWVSFPEGTTLDKTYSQLRAAMLAGQPVVLPIENTESDLVETMLFYAASLQMNEGAGAASCRFITDMSTNESEIYFTAEGTDIPLVYNG